MTRNELIVVGVDGSEGSRLALRWAVAEAQRSDGAVKAVTAWYWEGVEGAMLAANNPLEQAGHAKRISDREVNAVIAEFGSAVVGHRGAGGFQELLLGSVGGKLVGVDGSAPADPAIGFAFAEAELRHAPVLALHAATGPCRGSRRRGRCGPWRAMNPLAPSSSRPPNVRCPRASTRMASAATAGTGGMSAATASSGPLSSRRPTNGQRPMARRSGTHSTGRRWSRAVGWKSRPLKR